MVVGSSPTGPTPSWRIFFAAFFCIGLNFMWSSLFIFATPALKKLNSSSLWSTLAWQSGPVAGLLQPFVGAISDSISTPIGRRRPFVLCGLFITLLGLFPFLFAGLGT